MQWTHNMADRRKLPALDNAKKINNPDLNDIGGKNYTDTILRYGGLATNYPQLETNAKTVIGAINEVNGNVVANSAEEPSETLNNIKIKNTVYSIDGGGGGGSTVVPNPPGTPIDVLNSIEIDGDIYSIEGGSANSLAGLTDTDINDLANREYLTYDAGDKKWKNKNITDLLTSITKGKYCAFYTPLSANFLNCRLYIEPQVPPNTPTPSTGIYPTRYSTIAMGSLNNGNYTYYFSGLFRLFEYQGCTGYSDLSTLSWYYEDNVFKASTYFFDIPKYQFNCINNAGYTYVGPLSNSGSVDKSIGYWSDSGLNSSRLWIRDDQFNGDTVAFKSALANKYVIYESKDITATISIANYNMLVAAFGLTGWAIKLSWADLPFDLYGGEWDVVNKRIYLTWAFISYTEMFNDYVIEGDYAIYDSTAWDRVIKPGSRAICTNFVFESNTSTPDVDCFSIYDDKVIFNISSIGSSQVAWEDWLQEHTSFQLHYESDYSVSTSVSYSDLPATYTGVNFLWMGTEGTTEVQYYSSDAIAYINFTKAVIQNSELDYEGLVNKPQINNTTLIGNQSGSDLSLNDYEDLTNMPQINGHTLIGNKTGEDLDLGGGGGGGGDITIKTFQSDNQYVSASHAKYFEIGKIVFVDCVFSISGTITANTSIFSGLPAASCLSYLTGSSNTSSISRFYADNNNIYTAMTFSSNARTYHIYGSYLKS